MISSIITKFQTTVFGPKWSESSAWIADLEHLDNLEALKLTTEKISSAPIEHHNQAMQQLDMLLMIDQATQARVKLITSSFMRIPRDNRTLEAHIANVTYDYHRRMYLAYIKLVDYILKQKFGITNERMLLLFARTINTSLTMTKWRYFQDQVAPVGGWMHLHTLVKIAEKLTLLHKSILLYENDDKEVSLANLLFRSYMLGTLSKNSFSRQQIELTAQILEKWTINPKIQSEYVAKEHIFLVNLSLDKGADRARGFSITTDCRFWKTDALLSSIQTFLGDAETNKSLQRFNLNNLATATVLVDLFKKLAKEWTVEGYTRQRRREKRKPVNKILNIYHGFDSICSKLSPDTRAFAKLNGNKSNVVPFELSVAMHAPVRSASMTFEKHVDSEKWLIVDESKNGLGASLGAEIGAWVEPGKLVGLSSAENAQQLLIAEIKSVKKQPDGRYRVGLEVFNSGSTIAKISQVDEENLKEVVDDYFVDFSDMDDEQRPSFSGLYLPANNSAEESAMMIIPKAEYKPATQYLLNLGKNQQRVIVDRPLSNRDGWVRVKVKLVT